MATKAATKTYSVGALTGPFVASAAACGARPPIRLQGQDSRGWKLSTRGGDHLVLDEFGDLWWARSLGGIDVQIIRACWPDEITRLHDDIEHAIAALSV